APKGCDRPLVTLSRGNPLSSPGSPHTPIANPARTRRSPFVSVSGGVSVLAKTLTRHPEPAAGQLPDNCHTTRVATPISVLYPLVARRQIGGLTRSCLMCVPVVRIRRIVRNDPMKTGLFKGRWNGVQHVRGGRRR